MIFTAKLILYARVGLVSLFTFSLPNSCSGAARICFDLRSSEHLKACPASCVTNPWGIFAAGSSCREVQEYPGLTSFAGIQLLQEIPCWFAGTVKLPLAIRFFQKDTERLDSAVVCVSGSGLVLMEAKAGSGSY